NEPLFRLGASALDALIAGVPLDPLARYVEYWVLRLQGVYEAGERLSPEARSFLECVRTRSPLALPGCGPSAAALRELEAAHRALIARHLEKELKSVRVLRDLAR